MTKQCSFSLLYWKNPPTLLFMGILFTLFRKVLVPIPKFPINHWNRHPIHLETTSLYRIEKWVPFIQLNGPQLVFSDANRILVKIGLELFYIFGRQPTEYAAGTLPFTRLDVPENKKAVKFKPTLLVTPPYLFLLNPSNY